MVFVCVCVYVMASICCLFIDVVGLFCVCCSVILLYCVWFQCVGFVCGVLCCCVLPHWRDVRVWFVVVVLFSFLFLLWCEYVPRV